MSKYYRKIIHMININSQYLKNINKVTAYYKIQIKENQKKIQVLINDLIINKKIIYKIYLIVKKEDKYNLKYVGILQINKEGVANKTFFINKDKENISGLIVMALKENEKLKKENIVFYGSNDNNKSILNEIDFENYTQICEYKEKENFLKKDEKEDICKYKKENIKKEKDSIESNSRNSLNKDKNFKNKKNIINNLYNLNEDYKENNTKNNVQYKKQNKENVNNKSNNIKDDMKNKDKKNPIPNINTLDIIKEQLEKKKELKIFDELIENKENINPFEKAYENVKWVKIEMTDLIFLPIESWMYINNAFLVNCYRKFKHLILGKNNNEKTILLGVPDIYFIKESILANICGFKEFKCCKNTVPKAGEYGYWIIKSKL